MKNYDNYSFDEIYLAMEIEEQDVILAKKKIGIKNEDKKNKRKEGKRIRQTRDKFDKK